MKTIFFALFLASGAASAAEWTLDRQVDKFDDSEQCSISQYLTPGGSDLIVSVRKGVVSFSILGDQYPGSIMRFRVDKNEALLERDRFSTSDKDGALFLEQLRTGQTVLTEIRLWPRGSATTKAPIGNLPALIDECLAAK